MSDTIGARLRQARELRRLTLLQVSETTKVRTHYLQALESDDYSAIASAAQARGFLRIYAAFLEIDLTDLLSAAQSAPASAIPEAAAPIEVKPARSSLWAGLRERLGRRPTKQAEAVSFPTGLERVTAEQAVQAAKEPASIDAQPTRPTKPASEDVKKN